MFKPHLLALSITLTGFIITGDSFAQDQDINQVNSRKPPHSELSPSRGRQNHAQGHRSLRRMDTNDDELISREEYLADGVDRYARLFNRGDKDDDGYVTLEEQQPTQRQKVSESDTTILQACRVEIGNPTESKESQLATADSNSDGALSQDEFYFMLEQRALAQFDTIDSDGDDLLTPDEINASAQFRKQTRRALRSCVREQYRSAQ